MSDSGPRPAGGPARAPISASALAGRVSAIYFGFGALWILTSDAALALVAPSLAEHTLYSMVKGWAFILATAALLFFTLRAHIERWMRESEARERAESLAHRDAERMRGYVENAPLGVVGLDAAGVVLDANPAGRALLGDDVVGRSVVDLAPEDARETVSRALREVAEGGRYEDELGLKAPDGSTIWLHLRAVRLSADRTLAFALDLTARKRLEAQYLQAQKMEAVGTLAGGIAHDFNNVLTVILSYASMLDAEGMSPAERGELAREVCDAAERASNLTRQLLLFSRKQSPRHAPVNVSTVVQNLSRMLGRIVGEAVTLETRCAPSLPEVRGDAGMIEQVLMNLAVNARDAMPHGGKLSLRTAALTLDDVAAAGIRGARPGRYAVIEVEDAGVGIPPDVLPRIFEPFFTTKDPGRGTGLGLATVMAIVEQHRGWIDVRTRQGQGTTFRVAFPLAEAGEVAASTPPSALCPGAGRVLLVDDDDAVRGSVARALRLAGYEVSACRSGDAALAVWDAASAPFDLLLADVVLPGALDGVALADVLRARATGLSVVFMSGYDIDTARIGGSVLLAKPFAAGPLTAAVRDALTAR